MLLPTFVANVISISVQLNASNAGSIQTPTIQLIAFIKEVKLQHLGAVVVVLVLTILHQQLACVLVLQHRLKLRAQNLEKENAIR